jgi:hypothetical protein
LVRLGDHLYLDILPVEAPVENDFYRSLMIRAHLFAKITIDGDELSVALMDPDLLKKRLGDKEVTLPHHMLDDGELLLTASTGELQDFMLKHGDGRLFGDPERFLRQRNTD